MTSWEPNLWVVIAHSTKWKLFFTTDQFVQLSIRILFHSQSFLSISSDYPRRRVQLNYPICAGFNKIRELNSGAFTSLSKLTEVQLTNMGQFKYYALKNWSFSFSRPSPTSHLPLRSLELSLTNRWNFWKCRKSRQNDSSCQRKSRMCWMKPNG